MKLPVILSTCLIGSLFGSVAQANNLPNKQLNSQVPFIQNSGQVDSEVSYYAKLLRGNFFVTRDHALVYDLYHSEKASGTDAITKAKWAFKEQFVDSLQTTPQGIAPSNVQVSQYRGNKRQHWQQAMSVYDFVSLGEVYHGITVKLRASGGNVEKLFYVKPGANVDNIKIAMLGSEKLSVNSKGQLLLSAQGKHIAFTKPIAYQEIDGKRVEVAVKYTVVKNVYGFELGDYDRQRGVVIDPLLESTFLGGVNANPSQYFSYDFDIAYSIFTTNDSVYVGGVTQATDFPIVLGYDDTANASGNPDGFIARFSRDLSTLYASTFFGTEYFDRVSAIAMDSDGNIVATGQAGYGFPVTNGAYNYQGSQPVGGGFVAKFSPDLSSLIASAVVSPSNYPTKLAIGNGSIYFAGSINNGGLPVTDNAWKKTCSCVPPPTYGLAPYEGFAGRITPDLTTLQSMTYLGGDNVTGMAIAQDGSVYFSDGMSSGISGYLYHMDANLSVMYQRVSFYPGSTSGSSRHYFYDVAVGNGFVATVGQTYLNDLPVSANAFDASCGTDGNCNNSSTTLYLPVSDGFIAKYTMDLQLQAMTYFGGSSADSLTAVAIDSAQNILITGVTSSPDLATTPNAYKTNCGSNCQSVYIGKLNNDLSQLQYGSYLGKATVYDLAIADDDTAYLSGATDSADFPVTSGAFDTSFAGGAGGSSATSVAVSDAFISHFALNDAASGGGSGGGGNGGGAQNLAPIANAGSDQLVGSRQLVTLDGSLSTDSDGSIVAFEWRQTAGKSVSLINANNVSAQFTSPRLRRGESITLVFELKVTDNQGASSSDQVSIVVQR